MKAFIYWTGMGLVTVLVYCGCIIGIGLALLVLTSLVGIY